MSGTEVPKDRSLIWFTLPKKASSGTNSRPIPIGPVRRPSMQRISIRSKSAPALRPLRSGPKRPSIAHEPFNPSEIGVTKPDWRHYATTHELREREGSVAVAFTVVDDGHPPGYVKPIERGRKQSFSSGPPPLRRSLFNWRKSIKSKI